MIRDMGISVDSYILLSRGGVMLIRGRILVLLTLLINTPAQALEITLSVQPILPRDQIIKAYQPLADYLSAKTGHKVKMKGHINFLAYWAAVRKPGQYELVLDAAPFVDYRQARKGYQVLAKLPDRVSFSIVTHEDDLIFDLDELVLKRVATIVSPSIGALRLHSLFHNPMRQPRILYAKDANDAAAMVMDKRAFAAIIPTGLVSNYQALNTVTTTESLPHMGLSASPDIPEDVRRAVRDALVRAVDTKDGRDMLSKLNFAGFEAADAAVYKGYAELLRNELGY
jgi:hypothetical protein